jgi:hypothetical protein
MQRSSRGYGSLASRLRKLERVAAPSLGSDLPTWEEFSTVQQRVGARLAWEALDEMMADAVRAKEEETYFLFSPEMLEWCQVALDQFMKHYDPKQQEVDAKRFETYCRSTGWEVDERLSLACSLHFQCMDILDRIERAEDLIYSECWSRPQRAQSKEEREAVELVLEYALHVRSLKQWLAAGKQQPHEGEGDQ